MAWYAGATRRERIADALRRGGFDALLALEPENAAYLSGRTSLIATLWRVPGLASAVVGPEGRIAVAVGDAELGAYPEDRFARFPFPLWIERLDLADTPARGGDLLDRVRAARPVGAVARPAQYDPDDVYDAVGRAVRSIAPAARRVGADLATVPPPARAGLERRLPKVELVDAAAVFADLRALKDDDEIASLRLAAELTEIGIAAARDRLRRGMTAIAVTAAYQTAVWTRAAADDRFAALRDVEGLVSVGNGGTGGSRVVGPGLTVKLDMQVDVGGYHSDVGRTFAIAPTAEQRTVHAALRDALAAAQDRVRPGVAFRDVFATGIGAMRAAGFAGYSRGHLGHGVGLAHNYEEPPFVAADEDRPLVPGMVVSVELPYYLDGVGAFQLERMLLVTPGGHEALDRLPVDLEVPDVR